MEAQQDQAAAKEERPRVQAMEPLVEELVDDFDTITLPDLLFLASGYPVCSVFYWRRFCRLSNKLRRERAAAKAQNRQKG